LEVKESAGKLGKVASLRGGKRWNKQTIFRNTYLLACYLLAQLVEKLAAYPKLILHN